MNAPTLDTLLHQAEQLAPQEKLLLAEKLIASYLAGAQPDSGTGASPRRLGLREGEMWMAEDFDAPLPDSFWLGEDE